MQTDSLVCEVFHIELEMFETLLVKLPGTATASSAVSFHDNGEIIILTASNQMYRCNMAVQASVFTQSQYVPKQTTDQSYQPQFVAGNQRRMVPGGVLLANCQPTVQGRCYYWVRPMSGELCVFDVQRSEVTVKNSDRRTVQANRGSLFT